MNKNAIFGVGAVIVILIIAGFMFMPTSTQESEITAQPSASTLVSEPTGTPVATEQKSLRDLIGLGVSQQCTFSDGTTQGKVYVSNNKVRSDFTIVADGTSMVAHSIIRDNTSYFWTDGSNTGFKTVMNETPELSDDVTHRTNTDSVDVDKKGDYSCTPWVASDSLFALPTTVTFTDMSQLMQGANVPN